MSADASKLAALAAQATLFREAERRGYSRKAIAADTGFSLSTLASWATQVHEMPLSAFRQLMASKALPLDVLSLLLPDGAELVAVSADGMDHAALAAEAAGFAADHARASHPESEAGREIGRGEAIQLAQAAQRLRSVAGQEAG